jgi:hexosaminidase
VRVVRIILIAGLGVGSSGGNRLEGQGMDVIPAPASVTDRAGEFVLSENTWVDTAAPAWNDLFERQVRELESATGLTLRRGAGDGPGIRLVSVPGGDPRVGPEAYRLEIGRDGVSVAASTEAGAFYAFQTLAQLLRHREAASDQTPAWLLPAGTIEDEPRFPYRGLHLDVGRHFFSVEFVKRYIDLMSRFKLNRFHWHLTEDQGWRVEIDAFPRLTSVGAWRAESPVGKQLSPYVGDGRRHGGYYTKDQIRDVVAYAAERFVTIIPEIEMPGHATAAIASYPELGCEAVELDVSTTWGVHDSIFCPGEQTFAFLETVLDEVMDLFPAEHIHIGGDEVPRRQWRESRLAQEVMRREGLADEDELQSWFVHRIERHLRANGRRLIGWDEIIEGVLAPDATVMSWRGVEGGVSAARQGHDVIMTPVQHAYFDFYQGAEATEPLAMSWAGFPIPLERVYEFEPVPPDLTEAEAKHILGAQGNVWTEYIATPEYVEYMAYPRALALAEVTWSPRERRDWASFVARLPRALSLLDRFDVAYRFPVEVLYR